MHIIPKSNYTLPTNSFIFDKECPENAGESVKVYVFIATKKHQLKVINLNLKNEKLNEKLKKWENEDRFVLVTRKVDGTLLAHAHIKFAEGLENNDLHIDGKKVCVQALNNEDYHQLDLSELLLNSLEVEKTLKKNEVKKTSSTFISSLPSKAHQPEANLQKILFKMKEAVSQIVLKLAQSISESQRIYNQQQEDDYQEKQLQRDADKRQILTDEIKKFENKVNAQKSERLKQS